MKAITREYLVEFIFRLINKHIDTYRKSKGIDDAHHHIYATDEEVLDFIRSIPYFDNRLKDFIVGNFEETTIIISQLWENEFIIKSRDWADSFEWLYGDQRYLSDLYLDRIKQVGSYLGLPY
jgi:hypothetical protein